MPFITKRLTRWFFWTGLTVVFLGVSFSVGNWAWYRTRTWWAIDKPLDLRVGSVSTQEFKVNINENFLVLLEVDRGVPPSIAARVLGVGELVSKVRTETHGFKLRWTVFENGSVIKEGLSDGAGEGYWSDKRGRILGFFPAKSGQKYRINLDVLEDGEGLAPYHPTLKVQVDIFTLDGYAMGEGFSELAGLIVAGIGGLLLAPVLPFWGWLATRKTEHQQREVN
jgi:hypothetical protein